MSGEHIPELDKICNNIDKKVKKQTLQ